MSTIPWGTMNHWLYLDSQERANNELQRAAARERNELQRAATPEGELRPKRRRFAHTRRTVTRAA